MMLPAPTCPIRTRTIAVSTRVWPGAPRGTRCGSAYIMVLASAIVVTAITLGGLALNRVQRDSFQSQEDIRRARMAAASALEASSQILSPRVGPRGQFASGDGLPKSIDGVALSYEVIDPIDANLANDVTHPIEITVEARIGAARQLITGRMSPKWTPVGLARFGLAATGAAKLNNTVVDAPGGVYSGTENRN